jgi:hypothetical protein
MHIAWVLVWKFCKKIIFQKKAEEHNYYMIANNAISHDGFVQIREYYKAVGAKVLVKISRIIMLLLRKPLHG